MLLLGRTQMVDTCSYEDSIRRLMKCGFGGIEAGVFDRGFHVRDEFFSDGFGRRMRDIMASCGVKGYSVSAHVDFTECEEKFRLVYDAIAVAGEMEAPLLIINGAIKKETEAFERQWERQIRDLGRLCRRAQEMGILLALEFEPGFVIDSTDLMLRAFSEVGSPVLKANLDIGHVFLCDPDPMDAIARCKGLIAHAHLENMKTGVHNHLVPYEGDMDLPAYISALRDADFDGMASFDAYQYDYEAVAEKTIAYFKGIF